MTEGIKLVEDNHMERFEKAMKKLKDELRNLQKVDQELLSRFLDINENIHRLKAETTLEWQIKREREAFRDQVHEDSFLRMKKQNESVKDTEHTEHIGTGKFMVFDNEKLNQSRGVLLAKTRKLREEKLAKDGGRKTSVKQASTPHSPSYFTLHEHASDNTYETKTPRRRHNNNDRPNVYDEDYWKSRLGNYAERFNDKSKVEPSPSTISRPLTPQAKNSLLPEQLYSNLPVRNQRTNSKRRVRFALENIDELNEEGCDHNNNFIDNKDQHANKKEESDKSTTNGNMKSCLKKFKVKNPYLSWGTLNHSSSNQRKSRSYDDLLLNNPALLRRISNEIETTISWSTNEPVLRRSASFNVNHTGRDDFRRHSYNEEISHYTDYDDFPRSQSLVSLV
ncbi:uncharacterized protein LOC130622930 [Hydractinia symbiolongicarpus]|uniref:uncharacterized protein LOC130622930 n=1 Tax=Hydractinia symbiolongicarpus TaxID=13093 RepID=UPI002550BFEE|nr:uncharacterized protein LOC130622930 [Hydractinia symbiolongicarpus]